MRAGHLGEELFPDGFRQVFVRIDLGVDRGCFWVRSEAELIVLFTSLAVRSSVGLREDVLGGEVDLNPTVCSILEGQF